MTTTNRVEEERGATNDRGEGADDERGLSALGTGAAGTAGGMGATTGTDTIEDREDTDQ